MRILVITQALDLDHPVLGFFHRWVEELAGRVSSLQVIALSVGTYALPENVTVHSLGKEKRTQSPFIYALRFLSHAWALRNEYDVVFLHMNQEYVLLAGVMWKLLGKRVYLWRNHYAGSLLTHLAAMWCNKVFYTSRHSYTARFSNAERMPVGVDERITRSSEPRTPRSILWLGRISPSKHLELFIDALAILAARGVSYKAMIVGSPLPKDQIYYDAMRTRAVDLEGQITFCEGVPHHTTTRFFQTHEYVVNTSPSGMFDKTLFEAAAAGAIPLAVSDDWRDLVEDTRLSFPPIPDALAGCLESLLSLPEVERQACATRVFSRVIPSHRVSVLVDALTAHMVTIEV
ncbi:MAG: glycosyltransferase [Patescibacteria group bacterium]